ncbi:MAG: carboxypeptidase-like regulatory domain-containing protein, partial [Acidobacteriota bacterium]
MPPALLCLLLPHLAAAQTTQSTGTLQGTVRDRTGATIPHATLTARNQDTAAERRATTSADGLFTFRGLLPGAYQLTVAAPGFATLQTTPFPLSVGQIIQRDLELAPAGLTETLEVTDTPEAIDPAASSASVALGNERIEEAPARSRNYLNFVLAAPAVAPSAGSSSQRTMTGTRGTELSLKLNHQIGEHDTFAARYAFSRGRTRGEVQGPDNFADRSAQGNSLTRDHALVSNWLRVLSPTTVNDLRLQVAERRAELTPNGAGPAVEVPGVVTYGAFPRLDADRTERHYQLIENLNAALGTHRLSAGLDAHWVTLDASLRHRYAGIFVFPTLTHLLAGRPDLYLQAFGNPATTLTTHPHGRWLQDRWQHHPRLQLAIRARIDPHRLPPGPS